MLVALTRVSIRAWLDRWDVVATWGVAIGTLALAAYTGLLARRTHELGKLTDRSIQSQSRPWLTKPPESKVSLGAGVGPYMLSLRLANVGTGLAILRDVQLRNRKRESMEIEWWRSDVPVLAPEAEVTITVGFQPRGGEADYLKDSFGDSHTYYNVWGIAFVDVLSTDADERQAAWSRLELHGYGPDAVTLDGQSKSWSIYAITTEPIPDYKPTGPLEVRF